MLDFPSNPEFIFQFLINGIETFTLDQAPDGWLKTVMEFATSKSFVALQRSLTLPYMFIGNAAMLCRREYYTNGVMANIVFSIQFRQNDLSYKTIYTGKLNFADPDAGDTQIGFLVPCVNADFTLNIDAYQSVNYAIDISDGVNAQLPSLTLNETATLIPYAPPDGSNHGYYFPELALTNNVQSSVSYSVRAVAYDQFANPNFATRNSNFFWGHVPNGNLNIVGSLQFSGLSGSGDNVILGIYNQSGTLRYTMITTAQVNTIQTLNYDFVLPVADNEKLYLYVNQSKPDGFAYLTITGGELNLSYQTQSPPTMTKAISGEQLLSRLLIAMNPNNNGIPNLAVPYQSYLYTSGALSSVYFTCSDSIRSGNGSFYPPGSTIGFGIYQVLQGTVNYGGDIITAPNTFAFDGSTLNFTQVGATYAYVQKIQSIFVGNVYNSGDSLEQGGTFLVVSGTIGGSGIVYNGKFIATGTYFNYVLGADTFTQADVGGDNYVKQTAESPRIVTNLSDFFQCTKSLMFGDACLGVNPNTGIVFIETLETAFQSGAPVNVDLGNASEQWKRQTATDLMYANFKAGYADQQYTTANGYQEVNSTQEYSSGVMLTTTSAPANTYPSELNVVNPYRADPLGYEEMRISQSDTAASRSSNDVCMLWLNLTPVSTAGYAYYNPIQKADVTDLYGVVEGYYNFMLSPKSCLLRGINYLASIFYNLTSYPIVLASALKNSGMVYIYNGVRVGEADVVLVKGTPYFIPMYLTDTIGLKTDILSVMDINPYAPVKITVNNVDTYGFAVDFKVNAAVGDNESIKLLLSPKNVLSDLIR
jgi:hypothetical protein